MITANELKTGGIALIEAGLKDSPEVIISVAGKNRFVVMAIEHYQQLQEAQYIAAWQETKQDIKEGEFHNDIDQHLKKIKQAIES
jgi:prevent-host-death family protein